MSATGTRGPNQPLLTDYACPEAITAPPTASTGSERTGDEPYLAGRWSADALADLARHLDTAGAAALAALGDEEILSAWDEALSVLLDPASATRRALDPVLGGRLGYSPPLLQASLEAMLAGFRGDPARRVFAHAARLDDQLDGRRDGLVLAVLAGNVPALAVQVALPALAVRRPLLLKSSRREPLLAAAMVRLLARARPELADGVAAATWPGGDRQLEEGLLAATRTVVAFGSQPALDDLERRHRRMVARGPMLSLAVVDRQAPIDTTAAALVEDIALFEQQGCLSVRAIYVESADDAARVEELGGALAAALERLAERWPAVERDPAETAALQQARREAELRGQRVFDLDIAHGTVIVESDPVFRPLPPGRAVRLHPLASLDRLSAALEPLAGRIQGVALAGEGAGAATAPLERLGVRRLAPAGTLQRPDATWANGERHLVEVLA